MRKSPRTSLFYLVTMAVNEDSKVIPRDLPLWLQHHMLESASFNGVFNGYVIT